MSKIISVRKDHVVVYHNGTIMTKINDSYNRLKYDTYEGNRIHYKFDDEAEIQETYDDRIFNCVLKGETIQVRLAESLCDTIRNKDKSEYIELFGRVYFQVHKTELLNDLVHNSYGGRVVVDNNGDFIIDNRFKVDSIASAHSLKAKIRKDSLKKDNNRWSYLCIVVKGNQRPKKIRSKIGLIELDSKLLEILAKVDFLLHPNLKDNVFMGQLDTWLAKTLIAEAEVNVV